MGMINQVRNPLTGRWIDKDGSTYQRLQKSGIIFPRQGLKNTRKVPARKGTALEAPVTTRFKNFPVYTPEDVQWRDLKPNKAGERRALLTECGPSCFLIPGQKVPKFPVCNKLPLTTTTTTTSRPKCSYNCKGIKGAASRAGEWKYVNVLAAAKKLATKNHCYV